MGRCACSTTRCDGSAPTGSTSGRCTICATVRELDVLFGPSGALEAARQAQADGRIRFIGLTGHHDPDVLVEAMRRFPFDSVLRAGEPGRPAPPAVRADGARRGAPPGDGRRRNEGDGRRAAAATRRAADELIRYSASVADTVIIGCSTMAEVQQNLAVARAFVPMSETERRALEERIAPRAADYDTFKR